MDHFPSCMKTPAVSISRGLIFMTRSKRCVVTAQSRKLFVSAAWNSALHPCSSVELKLFFLVIRSFIHPSCILCSSIQFISFLNLYVSTMFACARACPIGPECIQEKMFSPQRNTNTTNRIMRSLVLLLYISDVVKF